ncbi:hypothetical protein GCM10027418_07850 [Mariniluteicoccus endophyticus]
MSDRPRQFSRPAFGPSGAGDRSDADDNTLLRRNLRGAGEPARPRGTAPSQLDAPARQVRRTDESVWAKTDRPAEPAMPAHGAYAGSSASAASQASAARHMSASSQLSAGSQASASAPPAAAAAVPPPARAEMEELLAQYPEQPGGGRKHRVRADGETLEVPLPGRSLSDARKKAATARGLAVAALVLGLAGLAATGGFMAVLASRNATGDDRGTTTTGETWNTAAGQAFGAQYLRACLTRHRGDDRAEESRMNQLQAMNVGAFDEACRATSGADQKPRTVATPVFTGRVEEMPGIPKGRYLSFLVDLDRTPTTYVVPVYLDDPAQGFGPAVVGHIGVGPSGGYGIPSGEGTNRVADPDLAASLRGEFLPQFMTAWAGSTPSLQQFLADDPTEGASSGLGGTVKDVMVTDVLAHPRKDSRPGEKVSYADGEMVDVVVTTTGTLPIGGLQASSYRVVIQRSGGKWFVKDAQGGVAEVPTNAPQPTKSPKPSRTPR